MPKTQTQNSENAQQAEALVETRQCPMIEMRAAILPETVNAEERTVRVQYTTGERVLRPRLFDEPFFEELSTEPGAVRLNRLNNGAPVLNSHAAFQLESVMGVVVQESADEQFATLQFSEREDVEPFWRDIQNGIIRNVSVGYLVHKFRDVTESDDQFQVLRAIDWEPMEISMVAVGADAGAGVRTKEEVSNCTIVAAQRAANVEPNEKGKSEMPKENEDQTARVAEQENTEQRGQNTETQTIDNHDQRGQQAETPDPEQVRKEATKAERQRVAEIQRAVRSAGFDQDEAEKLIEEGVTADQARKRILEEWTSEEPMQRQQSHVRVGTEESEKRMRAMENAMLHRFDPGRHQLDDGSREFRGMSLLDMARESAERNGNRVRGLSRREIAERAMHSTSDFPNVLANVANKTLRDAYQLAPRTFTVWARQATLPDFKEVSRPQLSEFPPVDQVNENGEYTSGTMKDGAEKYQLTKYGKIIRVTYETIINDDLDAFTRLPQAAGDSAAQKEADIVYAILTGNPTMADGNNLFGSNHKNNTNKNLGVDGLSALRTLMRQQKGLNGHHLNLFPQYLIVPTAQEIAASQLLTRVDPNKPADVNPFSQSLELVTEPRLDANNENTIYAAAAPSRVDTIEYGFLEGEEGPMVSTREGFEVDGMEIKVRHVFGAAPLDHRGLARSTNNA